MINSLLLVLSFTAAPRCSPPSAEAGVHRLPVETVSALAAVFAAAQDTAYGTASAAAHGIAAAADGDHGKLTWFQGSFDDLVREATKTKKVIFIDLWTTSCVWCKRLDHDTFSDDSVAALMKDVLCYSVDAESKDGAPLARRFGVTGYPTLVFLEPDGSLRDRITGYLPADKFSKEAVRIKSGEGTLSEARKKVAQKPNDVFAHLDLALALRKMNDGPNAQAELDLVKKMVARGEGFDPKSLDDRWKLSQRFAGLGDPSAAREQTEALKALDTECKSMVCRRLKMQDIAREANALYAKTKNVDSAPLIAFLKTETYPEVLFEGWGVVENMELFQIKEAHKNSRAEEERFHRAAARDAGREAWKYCPPDRLADWGGRFAAFLYEDAAALTPEEKDLAVDVATRASEAAPPKSLEHLEVLACCLYAAGRRDEAVSLIKSGLEIDPERTALKNRLAEFQR
jgi:thioredoxin-related protein